MTATAVRQRAEAVEQVPVLDVGPFLAGEPGALATLAAELRYACENVGFHAIRGHGVPQSLIDGVFAEAARFHAQPLEAKLAVKINEHNIGYLPIKGDLLRSNENSSGSRPNLNAAFFIRNDRGPDHPDVVNKVRFRGMNQWPAELPGFRETTMRYFAAMEALGRKMLPVYAVALDLAPDHFDCFFDDCHATLRLSHYPPQPRFEADQYSLAPHTDSGFMTMLAPNAVPGLQIQTREGGWLKVEQLPGTFMVNSGDMLHRWTNGRFLSTLHRVLNESGGERYAIPFFFNPSVHAMIECLPTCQGPGNPPRHKPILYGDYFAWFVGRNYTHQKGQGGPTQPP